jgi:hypothetical protein
MPAEGRKNQTTEKRGKNRTNCWILELDVNVVAEKGFADAKSDNWRLLRSNLTRLVWVRDLPTRLNSANAADVERVSALPEAQRDAIW